MSRRTLVVGALLASALLGGRAHPQDEDEDLPLPEELVERILGAIRDSDPDTFNQLLSGLSRASSMGRFLEDVNFRFKTFDDGSGEASLGFAYDFQKALRVSRGDSSSMSFDFYGRGNVAFDEDVNPEDFLETGFRLHVYGAHYGHVDLGAVEKRLSDPATPGPANKYQEFFAMAAKSDLELEEIFAHPVWHELKRSLGDLLGDELFWDLAAHASLESDQEFSSRQYAYGLRCGLVLRDWDPGSNRTQFNLFDYPFAALRFLTRTDEDFRPSGRAWPSLLAGLDLVDPGDNSAREALGEDDPHPRVRAELGMKTRVAAIEGGDLWASLGYRYYRELDPPDAIEQAELHEQSFFAASLDFPAGWFVRYATGRLPVDEQNDDVFELGWAFRF